MSSPHHNIRNNNGNVPTTSRLNTENVPAGAKQVKKRGEKATFDEHFVTQGVNREAYAAKVALLIKNNVEISQNARVRALAASWARKDHVLANALLASRNYFGLVEVLKALTLLDSARKIRIEEKKLQQLKIYSPKDISGKKKGAIKANIDNLTAIKPKVGSASGAVCKHVKRWVRGFSKDELEFFALHFPKDPWKKLADICHLNPEKDFPTVPWFLRFCFGDPPPADSLVYQCNTMLSRINLCAAQHTRQAMVNDLIRDTGVPYSHIKDYKDILSNDTKAILASRENVHDVLWNYEDLQCRNVDDVLLARLEEVTDISMTNGKLLERLLTIKMIHQKIPTSRPFISKVSDRAKPRHLPESALPPFFDKLLPIAQLRLKDISIPLEAPVVVFGDRSASMDVAVRTSTIIAALLSSVVKAQLVFFNRQALHVEAPTDMREMLNMSVNIEATGGTAPAAALWPYYTKKEVVKTIIVVTDEEENYSHDGYNFAFLYHKYHQSVYPARLVFVSFLKNQHATGPMVSQLKTIGYKPLQFKFDSTRPDLNKLDTMFGQLAMKSGMLKEAMKTMEDNIKEKGMAPVFTAL